MASHTPEPWLSPQPIPPERHAYEGPPQPLSAGSAFGEGMFLSFADYARARACVNALAGYEYPDETIRRLETLEEGGEIKRLKRREATHDALVEALERLDETLRNELDVDGVRGWVSRSPGSLFRDALSDARALLSALSQASVEAQ